MLSMNKKKPLPRPASNETLNYNGTSDSPMLFSGGKNAVCSLQRCKTHFNASIVAIIDLIKVCRNEPEQNFVVCRQRNAEKPKIETLKAVILGFTTIHKK